MLISVVVVLIIGGAGGGCAKDAPAQVFENKTFCWQIEMVNPYGYLYYNRCQKDDVIIGEIEGTKIMYKNNLEDRRKEFRFKAKKELF